MGKGWKNARGLCVVEFRWFDIRPNQKVAEGQMVDGEQTAKSEENRGRKAKGLGQKATGKFSLV